MGLVTVFCALTTTGAGEEGGHAPEIGAFLGGEEEIDLFEVVAAVVTGDTQALVAQKRDGGGIGDGVPGVLDGLALLLGASPSDRESTRLNSSHLVISYAVF